MWLLYVCFQYLFSGPHPTQIKAALYLIIHDVPTQTTSDTELEELWKNQLLALSDFLSH